MVLWNKANKEVLEAYKSTEAKILLEDIKFDNNIEFIIFTYNPLSVRARNALKYYIYKFLRLLSPLTCKKPWDKRVD